MNDSDYQNFLLEFVQEIIDRSLKASEERKTTKKKEDYDYLLGKIMGYYDFITLMQMDAQTFGIPLKSIGLDKIEPDKDLLR
jgi:hypothetical protein